MERLKRLKSIGKLYDELQGKGEVDLELAPVAPQWPELSQLWEVSSGGDVHTADAACTALVSLVRTQRLHLAYVLHGFINQAPGAKQLASVVRGVADLLVHQLMTHPQGKAYSCSYSIRQPPHPFVSILINRSDSWPLLLQQCKRIVGHPNSRVSRHAVALLSPFIKYVLLEPSGGNGGPVRLALCTTLSADPQMLSLLTDCLPALPLSTSSQVAEACLILETLRMASNNTREPKTTDNGQQSYNSSLVIYAVELSEVAVSQGLDPQTSLDLAERMLEKDLKRDCVTEVYLSLVSLLNTVPHSHKSQLIRLVQDILLRYDSISPVAVAMVMLPLLNIVAMGNPIAVPAEKHASQRAATKLMKVVEDYLSSTEEWTHKEKEFSTSDRHRHLHMTSDGFSLDVLAKLSSEFSANQNASYNWLLNLLSCSDGDEDDQTGSALLKSSPYTVASLLSSISVCYTEKTILRKTLQCLGEVCKDIDQCPSLLPLLLYRMNRDPRPDVKHLILMSLPNIATHKVLLAPVLSTIQHVVGRAPHMRAVSLRLVCRLWQQQDRCFPHLQHMLLERESHVGLSTREVGEIVLAKAACIRDICKCRPARGADMLGALSGILNESSEQSNPTPAALALEGLYFLCEAEVIDIRTTWAVLAEKLDADTRPLVIQYICRLFSLVPPLAVDTAEYQGFRAEVVDRLWEHASSSHHQVAAAAFQALAQFSPEDFNITHLPEQVTEELMLAAEEAARQAEAEGPRGFEHEPIELPAIAGYCYTRMLPVLQQQQQLEAGYGTLLSQLVRQEVLALPRGISHMVNRNRQSHTSDSQRGVANVPQFLKREYDHSRQPALRPALAASLLFAYDPVLPLNKEGNAKKSEVIKYGRAYVQMLSTLLQEVPLYGEESGAAEWQRSLSAPAAWSAFMDRCYNAYIQCRQGELVLQLEQGKADDTEENDFQQQTAWLWARSKLTDIIKSVSRGGSPHVQGNCVLALSALAVASATHAAGVEAQQLQVEATAHLSQAHWLGMVTHTTLALLDYSYQPPGRIFNICQQRGSGDDGGRRHTASVGARAGACLALGLLVPLLLPAQSALVHTVLELLGAGLSHGEDDKLPQLLSFHYGVGMGTVLAALFHHRFTDIDGSQGIMSVERAVLLLEKSALEGAELGSWLGLAAALGAMCHDGNSHEHVLVMLETLLRRVEGESSQDQKDMQGACVCLSAVGVEAYATNLIDHDTSNRVVAALYARHSSDLSSAGACLALAALCHGLAVSGHPTIADLAPQLYRTWHNTLLDCETSGPGLYMVALAGATAMAGSQHMWMQVESSGEASKTGVNLSELVKLVCEQASGGDMSIQAASVWMVGLLYQAVISAQHTRSSVPLNYSYLPDTSVLKACVQLLTEAAKKGMASQVHSVSHVESVLRALLNAPPLPPLNWSALLSPLMRGGYGSSVEWLCLRLAVNQASAASPSASLFLSSWLLRPLYNSIQEENRKQLYGCLPSLIKVVPASKLQEYLDQGFMDPFSAGNTTLQVAALRGLAGALKVPDPPQSVTALLYAAVERLWQVVESHQLAALCECLQYLPEKPLQHVMTSAAGESVDVGKEMYVRTWLVARSAQPLPWISAAIEQAMCDTDSDSQERSMRMLLDAFIGCQLHSTRQEAALRQQWLLELMGYIRNVAGKVTTVQPPTTTRQAVHFLIAVFSAVALSWSKSSASVNLPAVLKSSCKDADNKDTDKDTAFTDKNTALSDKDTAFPHNLQEVLYRLLPVATVSLLQEDSFKPLTSRALEWLIGLCSSEEVQQLPLALNSLTATLHALRHSKEFGVGSVWGRVYSLKPPAASVVLVA